MNILSMLSNFLTTAFLFGGIYCLTRDRKFTLNFSAFLVLFSLAWWNFCNAFFFSADTEETAWFWHKLASFGWTGFVVLTTYYFTILTGVYERVGKLWIRVLFFVLPTILLIHNLFGETTSLAEGLTRSTFGDQWTYVNALTNVWLWLYLVYLICYFGYSFVLLLHWSVITKNPMKRKMSIGFVLLDTLTIFMGFISDILFPLTTPMIPAAANLCTAVFGFGYFFIIIRYDLFDLFSVIDDNDIIEHGLEGIIVIDEKDEILYCNQAAAELMESEKRILLGTKLSDYFSKDSYAHFVDSRLQTDDMGRNSEVLDFCKRDTTKQFFASATVIRDKQGAYTGTVVCFMDLTQQNQLKEQYYKQSQEYERLAYFDALTGVANRRKIFSVLNEKAAAYKYSRKDFCILYMDLNEFKSVNDKYGHNVGDILLSETTERLKGCLYGEMTFLGRLGGDEFLILIEGDTSDEVIGRCKRRINEAFKPEFTIGSVKIKNSLSIGSARFSDHLDIDETMQSADKEMYAAKKKIN